MNGAELFAVVWFLYAIKFGTEKLERRVKATGISCLRRERHWKFGSYRVVYLLKLASKRRVAKSFILPRGKEMDYQDQAS
jgi:hypothetical protein